MQESKTACLTPSLGHTYHYFICNDGATTWICTLCGDTIIEFEDCSM